jgi:hypothetical protein
MNCSADLREKRLSSTSKAHEFSREYSRVSTSEGFQASGAEQKPATGVRVADMKRGPIGPLFMSAAKILTDYVGMISPVSGSTSAAALAWFCSALKFDRRRFVDWARR